MAFIDFNQSPVLPAARLRADFVIIGAGAAGIFLAVKLAAHGRRVLLVESGHFHGDPERQSLNAVAQSGKPISDPIWNRKRILGGTTTAWGGQSLPFSPLDFSPRPWIPDSGWPIPYAEMVPHYSAANTFMGVDEWNYDTDLFARLSRPDPGFDPTAVHYHFSKWLPEPNFFKTHRRALAGEALTVLYNAHLTRIDRDASGRVATIAITNFLGRTQNLPVAQLILAAGGIETNRILLQNDHQTPGGIGNHSGWLGRAFMEHPAMTVGRVTAANDLRLQSHFASHFHRLRKYSVRLSAAESWQRRHGLLAASASLMFLPEPMAAGPLPRLVRKCAHLATTAATLLARGFVYRPGTRAALSIMVEQAPLRESHITLDTTVDRFDRRLARLHWHIDPLSWRTAVAFTRVVKTEIERLGLGRVELDPHVSDDPRGIENFTDVNHHMGGTRIGAAPADGVVTPTLQVWHVPNLHICSCSVFPTSSHSNPTLTMLALCDRLVPRLLRAPRAEAVG